MNKSKTSAPAKSKTSTQGRRQKVTTGRSSTVEDQPTTACDLPIELQQLLLNIFENAFPGSQRKPLADILQEVKGHLYNRDFSSAFGKDEYLRAYAFRWSSSRALGYLRLLDGIFKDYFDDESEQRRIGDSPNVVKIGCIGGGAGAEIVALAGVVKLRSKPNNKAGLDVDIQELGIENQPTIYKLRIEAVFVDVADWGSVIQALHQGTTTPPPLSAYASATAKASNVPLILPSSFKSSFVRHDVLAMSEHDLRTLVAGNHLITIFFTLNELYTTSLPKTQAFLLKMTQVMDPGTLLLVVDSAGSYSTVKLNGQEKKYPMQWLLDHALLKSTADEGASRGAEYASQTGGDSGATFEKLQEKESEWFKIPKGLKYTLDVENMRYQLHLYRRL